MIMASPKKSSDAGIIKAALRFARARKAYRMKCANPNRAGFTSIAREYAEADEALAEAIETQYPTLNISKT